MSVAVEIVGLTKHFGEAEVISGLTLSIEKGLVAGLIGPDGAGKSTLLRLLIGLLLPSSGTIRVAGFDVACDSASVKDRIGYMPQHFSLYGDLSVAENMKFFADLYGVGSKAFRSRKAELLAFSGLSSFESRLARNLSGGMQKKLALACNLFHKPEILFLDEPTTGVDPVSRRELWRLLGLLNEEGVTIVLTTPYMDEAARCGRVGFLFEGRLLAEDAPAELIAGMQNAIVEVTAPITVALPLLKNLTGIRSVHPFGNVIHVVFEGKAADPEIIRRALTAAGVAAVGVRIIPPSFEDVFLAFAQRSAVLNDVSSSGKRPPSSSEDDFRGGCHDAAR